MTLSELSGKALTVLGPIDPDRLGVTLTHEHLLIDMGCYFAMPDEASERANVDAPFTMELRGRAAKIWNYGLDLGQLYDADVAASEVARYRHAGGDTLVDATSTGIGRDPLALARISRTTGLNLIMGASYYVPAAHPPDMDSKTEDEIRDEIVRDITIGVGETGVRAGIIGEVGNYWPMSDNEVKILKASARAQVETGAPILIHPGFDGESLLTIMGVLTDAGAEPSRVIMGHLDMFPDRGLLRSLAETGCYMEYDTFGSEDTNYGAVAHQTIVVPSDFQRLEAIEFLIKEGYGDRVVIAHDVYIKRDLAGLGGKGFDRILTETVPFMRRRGFTEDQIQAILVDNPRDILTFR